MEGNTEETQMEALIEEQLSNLDTPTSKPQWSDPPSQTSLWNTTTSHPTDYLTDPNRHRFHHYADKQLKHLVVSEEFDFQRIAKMLNYVFREQRHRYSETSCRERWEELHRLRQVGEGVREKKMQQKRSTSVATFSDPYSLYNLDEMLDQLALQENRHLNQQAAQDVEKLHTFENKSILGGKDEGVRITDKQVWPSNYNIFKDSIRRIDDIEGYRKREQEMLDALNQARDPSHIITDKLMHFTPYYERLNQFEVHEQELTEEKMKEIMSLPIEIDRLQMELRVKDMNETAEGTRLKRPKKEEKLGNEQKYEIQEDWDEYESD